MSFDAVNLLEETLFALVFSIWWKMGSRLSALVCSPVHDTLKE
jgi:hypothetical protein